ncbi:MAG: hypothetical protein IKO42_01735 [Opitutales bacterium]|nr:hypothetical protein [Opitutales bacterium]
MSKKVKIAIIAALALAGAWAYAQQIFTYQCGWCGKIVQTTRPVPPKCSCGSQMWQR